MKRTVANLARRLAFFLACLCTAALLTGCCCGPCGLADEWCAQRRAWNDAECAWQQYCKQNCPNTQCSNHMRRGFIVGYYNVAMGSDGRLPAVPEEEYWGARYRSASGQTAIASWFQGYPLGAAMAEQRESIYRLQPPMPVVNADYSGMHSTQGMPVMHQGTVEGAPLNAAPALPQQVPVDTYPEIPVDPSLGQFGSEPPSFGSNLFNEPSTLDTGFAETPQLPDAVTPSPATPENATAVPLQIETAPGTTSNGVEIPAYKYIVREPEAESASLPARGNSWLDAVEFDSDEPEYESDKVETSDSAGSASNRIAREMLWSYK